MPGKITSEDDAPGPRFSGWRQQGLDLIPTTLAILLRQNAAK